MLRKLGLGISYFFALAYIVSFVVPFSLLLECVRLHGLEHCQGNGLDAFLPAAALTPFGSMGSAFALRNSIQNIKKRQSLWLFWPLAIIFAIVLAAVIGAIALVFYVDVTGNFALFHPSVRH
jgi:hypothetical protein